MSEVVVVGGGLAGAGAAAGLAQAGVGVLLLEREREPSDKICGEFLSAEAQLHLAALGFDLDRLGGAPVRAMRLVAGRRAVEARLPFTALGISRRRLDAALLAHARAAGARVELGVAVRRVTADGLETSQGPVAARAVFLASGKHDVRGARRDVAGALSGLVGFKSHFRLSPAMRAELEGYVEIILFDGGYAGLQLVEQGRANLCLLVRRDRLEAAGRTWPALLAELAREPHLARRLAGALELSSQPCAIADVPYGFLHRGAEAGGSLYRLGDQAAVIPSFAGDGMSIALHSARLAARAVIEGADAGAYHARLRGDVGRQVRLATWLQRRIDRWPGRDAALAGLSLAPGLLPRLAAWTRLSAPALRRARV